MRVEPALQDTPLLPVTPDLPRIVLSQQPRDQVMIDASEGGKRRRDSDPGPCFVTGPGSGSITKKRGTDHKKEGGAPGQVLASCT